MSGPEPPGISPADLPQTEHEAFFLGMCLAAIPLGWPAEKIEKAARHWWPLHYYQRHGIEMGRQWDTLGWLALRYARDFGTTELAAELDEVIAASPQNRRRPWERGQVWNIAARAKEYIGREDQKEWEQWRRYGPGLMRWCEKYAAQARARRQFSTWARREVSS